MSIVKVDPLRRPVTVEVESSTPTMVSIGFGEPGVQGPPGPRQVFVQSTQPVGENAPYLWIQTGLPNDGVTFWFEDGL